jgi:hypothetical protein
MQILKSLETWPPYRLELAILAIGGGFCAAVIMMIRALTHGA